MTREQKEIIKSLTQSFEKLNLANESKGSFINISDIIDKQTKLVNRDKEIKLMQSAYDESLSIQIDLDIEKIRPEIEQMGINLRKINDSIEIYINGGEYILDKLTISYAYTNQTKVYNQFYEYESFEWIRNNPKVFYNVDHKYGGVGVDNIEEFVKLDKFREGLAKLYRKLIG